MKKKIFFIVVLVILVLFSILVGRAARFQSKQIKVAPAESMVVDIDEAAVLLSAAVTFPTVSRQDSHTDKVAFAGFQSWIEQTFPHAMSAMEVTTFSSHGKLYFWRGSDGGRKTVMLAAHIDVVPANPANLDRWTYPPFSGAVKDGYIWGRGTMDDKGNAIAIMAAVNRLAKAGYKPSRSLLLAFGHDEEIGGGAGAAKFADYLESNKISLYAVLDEGLAVTQGLTPGVDKPVALIGVSERGYASLKLTAHAESGHSSMPPKKTAIGLLATALKRLEDNPFPADIQGPVATFFDWIGPEMPFAKRLVFANTWLTKSAIIKIMEKNPSTNAMIRTTAAPTILKAGIKENVLPTTAEAIVNFRIAPGMTVDQVVEDLTVLVKDLGIEVGFASGFNSDPSPVSPVEDKPFHQLHMTVQQVFPEVLVAPSLVIGATDARYYTKVSKHVFRFSPMRIGKEDLPRFHGINERLHKDNFADMIRFFHRYIVNTTT